MRLRRLTEHLRTQNWTAVEMDFVIVAVGAWVEESRSLFSTVTYVSDVSEDGSELLSRRAKYDLETTGNDQALLPSLSNILSGHLMEVGWRNGIADRDTWRCGLTGEATA